MDRTWIQKLKTSPKYVEGVKNFIQFAIDNGATIDGKLKCPCPKCNNVLYQDEDIARAHMMWFGFDRNYTKWFFHGEKVSESTSTNENIVDTYIEVDEDDDGMRDMLYDASGFPGPDGDVGGLRIGTINEHDVGDDRFNKLWRDSKQPLYLGCTTYTRLSSIVKLYHLKCLSGWSNKSFTSLLEILKVSYPEGAILPDSYEQTKRMFNELSLGYKKIDACPNDCMLYWKESANKESCDICGTSRYKEKLDESQEEKKISGKILSHFPLKPRLQQLFMSSKTASDMRWHEEDRNKDGLLRHPVDSVVWKTFDSNNPTFALDPRNVGLGLASDGFNPYRTLSISHSTWPVVLFPYNLPPWMCMKQPNMILSLLIPGPLGPGNDIDIYLRPLIEELKELWEYGLETYDSSKKETFQMRAALMWTISDFPGYAILSGWSTKGKMACPCCHKDTCSIYLYNGRKQSYMGHCRWLPYSHRFRQGK